MALLTFLAWMVAFNAWQFAAWFHRHMTNDFRLYYGAARIGLDRGWDRIYDIGLQQQTDLATWPGFDWWPYLNPPPLAWLMAPLTVLPAATASVVWMLVVTACLLASAGLAGAPDRWSLTWRIAAAAGFLPTFVALALGQVVPVVALALVGCWALLRTNREYLAGLALLPLLLKPQLALLVPVALLLIGRWRAFLAWFVPTAGLGLLSVLSLGAHGLQQYAGLLIDINRLSWDEPWSLRTLVGSGWAMQVAQAAVVAGGLFVVRTGRHRGPGFALSVTIMTTLLANTYLSPADLTILLVPVWLMAAQAHRQAQSRMLAVALWAIGWLAILTPPVFVLGLSFILVLLGLDYARSPASPEHREWLAMRSRIRAA